MQNYLNHSLFTVFQLIPDHDFRYFPLRGTLYAVLILLNVLLNLRLDFPGRGSLLLRFTGTCGSGYGGAARAKQASQHIEETGKIHVLTKRSQKGQKRRRV